MQEINGYIIYPYQCGHRGQTTRWVVADPNNKPTPTAIGATVVSVNTESEAAKFARDAMPASERKAFFETHN